MSPLIACVMEMWLVGVCAKHANDKNNELLK